MKIRTLILTAVCGITTITSSNAFPFSWPMFTPAITGMRICSPDDLSACNTSTKCDKIGLYWYGFKCNANKHQNQINIERLAGSWLFIYNYYWSREDKYYFDENKVSRCPLDAKDQEWENEWQNAYVIYGVNEKGEEINAIFTPMTVSYNPTISNYYAGDYNNLNISKHYVFHFVSDNKISGTFFNIADDNWQNNPNTLEGYRLIKN